MTVRIEVQHADGVDSELTFDDISSWVRRAISAVRAEGELVVSVRIVDANEMRQLNGEYRGKDSPTNVLSFPTGGIDGLPPDAELPLGDLVICASVVADEAVEQGKSADAHWAHMLVHGTLHLLGFDHEEDREAADMEAKEIQILARYGIANPYGESPTET